VKCSTVILRLALAPASRARSKRPYRCSDCRNSNLSSEVSAAISGVMLQVVITTTMHMIASTKALRVAAR
jgi:hypothetical protein